MSRFMGSPYGPETGFTGSSHNVRPEFNFFRPTIAWSSAGDMKPLPALCIDADGDSMGSVFISSWQGHLALPCRSRVAGRAFDKAWLQK
jgi:hypothetical protein